MHMHICVPIPPFTSTHTYIITMCIFFVHYGFGLKPLLFVKVVLIVVFLFLVCGVFGVYYCRGLFFYFVWGWFVAKAFAGLGATVVDNVSDLPSAAASLEGMLVFQKDTNQLKICDGANWISVIDTDAPPGMVYINTLPLNGVSSGSINNVFSSEFMTYQLIYSGYSSVSGAVANSYLQMRSGGTTSAVNYTQRIIYMQDAASVSSAVITTSRFECGMYHGANGFLSTMTLNNPFVVTPTVGVALSHAYTGSGTTITAYGAFTHADWNSYDGFTFSATNNIFGSIRIYGLRN